MVTESDSGQSEKLQWLFSQLGNKHAEKGCLSDALPICPGPNKYCSLKLLIKASLHAQVAVDKLNVPVPRDEAPINRFYTRLFMLNLCKHSNFEILYSLMMF